MMSQKLKVPPKARLAKGGKSQRFQKGQSLIEVLVGLSVGAIIIGGALGLIIVNVRNSLDTRLSQTALSISQELMESAKSIASSDWNKIYNLSKGSANPYFPVATGTQFLFVSGEESILENNINSGLVGHWKFDEATGNVVYDFSGNINNGILTNGPTRTIFSSCKIGNCLSFDGADDYVLINDSSSLNVSTEFTFAGWIYTTANSALQTILSKDGVGTDTTGAYNVYVNTNLSVQYETNNINSVSSPANAITMNKWHHFAITFDNSASPKLKIYVNGIEIASGSSTAPSVLTTNLLIGRRGVDAYFNGRIDDIRVYNRALSADEIKNFYNSKIFIRQFYVDNINRLLCGIGDVTADATTDCASGPGASGVADDPSTQKITTVIKTGDNRTLVTQYQYLTRSWNYGLYQTDWSGGSGQEGPISKPNSKFYSSTNADSTSTPGAIKIQLP